MPALGLAHACAFGSAGDCFAGGDHAGNVYILEVHGLGRPHVEPPRAAVGDASHGAPPAPGPASGGGAAPKKKQWWKAWSLLP